MQSAGARWRLCLLLNWKQCSFLKAAQWADGWLPSLLSPRSTFSCLTQAFLTSFAGAGEAGVFFCYCVCNRVEYLFGFQFISYIVVDGYHQAAVYRPTGCQSVSLSCSFVLLPCFSLHASKKKGSGHGRAELCHVFAELWGFKVKPVRPSQGGVKC